MDAFITRLLCTSRLSYCNCRHIITFLSSLRGRYCWPIGPLIHNKRRDTANACAETWIFGGYWIIAVLVRDRRRSETSLQAFPSLLPFRRTRLIRHIRNGVGLRVEAGWLCGRALRQRRARAFGRSHGRSPFAAVRHDGSRHQPPQQQVGCGAHQRSRPVRAWARDRPDPRGSERDRVLWPCAGQPLGGRTELEAQSGRRTEPGLRLAAKSNKASAADFEVPASPAASTFRNFKSISGTRIKYEAVPLCFRSSCLSVLRCITSFGSGALAGRCDDIRAVPPARQHTVLIFAHLGD